MVPLGARQAHRSIASAVTLLVLLVGLRPHPSLALEPDLEDDRLLDQVQETLSRDGPYSLALLEPLTRLGELYQESEDHALALATLERAVQVVRINRGLHSLDQVPLLRQIIRIEEVRGNDAGAWDREQKLLALVRRHRDDLRTVAVLRDIADKQMEVLARVLAGKRPPQVLLGCFYQQWPNRDGGSCHAGSRSTVIQGMLAEAQRNYADAIGVMLHNGLYGSDELRELELQVLHGVDLLRSLNHDGRGYPVPMVPGHVQASSLEPWRSRMAPVAALVDWQLATAESMGDDDGADALPRHASMMDPYQRGRQSLQRLYEYSAASSSRLEQADAMVQLADWDLLHSRNGHAVDSYVETLMALHDAGVDQASIDELFAPAVPVVLPAFNPNPLVGEESTAATGHIDVGFQITKYGRARAIEIRDAANASSAAQNRLVALLKRNRFRPRATAGQIAEATPVLLRYHLYE
jgi:hypothetical protein